MIPGGELGAYPSYEWLNNDGGECLDTHGRAIRHGMQGLVPESSIMPMGTEM